MSNENHVPEKFRSKKFLNRLEQAEYLSEYWGIPTSPKTLQKYATTGGGPPYVKAGKRVLSTLEWLDEYAESKVTSPVKNSSQLNAAGGAV